MNEDTRYWFPAKRPGWGWGLPVTWEGRVVLIAWGLLLMGGLWFTPRNPVPHIVFAVLMIIVLTIVCYWKGEPPRWRSGEDR